MENRVMPFGLGGTFIKMKLNELPEDIQQGIIDRFKQREGKLKITVDTVNIVLACSDIFAKDI